MIPSWWELFFRAVGRDTARSVEGCVIYKSERLLDERRSRTAGVTYAALEVETSFLFHIRASAKAQADRLTDDWTAKQEQRRVDREGMRDASTYTPHTYDF